MHQINYEITNFKVNIYIYIKLTRFYLIFLAINMVIWYEEIGCSTTLNLLVYKYDNIFLSYNASYEKLFLKLKFLKLLKWWISLQIKNYIIIYYIFFYTTFSTSFINFLQKNLQIQRYNIIPLLNIINSLNFNILKFNNIKKKSSNTFKHSYINSLKKKFVLSI